jgi:hypothetical protein
MEEKLKKFKGRKLDVNCGAGATFRGTVEDVEDGILMIKDEMDVISHIAIGKIIVLTECSENATRPGFIG